MKTNIKPQVVVIIALFVLLSAAIASAQDLHTKVTYLCNGERLLIESCNMRDQSDTSTCLVQHPDRPKHNGFVAYTNETRGTLKKLIATCKQPTADEVAHAEAFAKKQQEKQDAILQQNLKRLTLPFPRRDRLRSGSSKSQRDKVRVARCLSAGRTEGQCVGNEFGKAFQGVFDFAGSMLGMKPPQAGLYLNGIYEGKGGWNISFAPDSVAMQCSDLVTDDHPYKIEFKGTQVVIKVETKPEPLLLAYREGKLYGSAPVKVDGAIVIGTIPGSGGGGGGSSNSVPGAMTSNTETTNSTRFVSPLEAQAYQQGGGSGTLQQSGAVLFDPIPHDHHLFRCSRACSGVQHRPAHHHCAAHQDLRRTGAGDDQDHNLSRYGQRIVRTGIAFRRRRSPEGSGGAHRVTDVRRICGTRRRGYRLQGRCGHRRLWDDRCTISICCRSQR